jgi:hypothetical protein
MTHATARIQSALDHPLSKALSCFTLSLTISLIIFRNAEVAAWVWCLGALLPAIALSLGFYLSLRDGYQIREMARALHDINHLYRDALSGWLSVVNLSDSDIKDDALAIEQKILESVCSKIAGLFSVLISRSCVVTVKLMLNADKELTADKERLRCFTWARSERSNERDLEAGQTFEVSEANTAFYEALVPKSSRQLLFFHSADLLADKDYRNTRMCWGDHYKSTIVVPIRLRNDPTLNEGMQRANALGFLTVDTRTRWRLNDHYHIELLSAFADQMSNFICLMRRIYVLRSHQIASHE